MSDGEAHHYAPLDPAHPGIDPTAARAVEAFFALFDLMHTHYGTVCASLDLTPSLGAVLRGLSSPSPMRELARSIGLDASNLTGLVDRLERRGLLRRQPDPDDRRVRQLVLTEEGSALRQTLNTRLFADPPLLAGLDAEQREHLERLLGRAARSACRPPGPPS